MKTVNVLLKVILPVLIIGLGYLLYDQIMNPERFDKERSIRETAVIQRLKDIRSAQHAFKQGHARYVGSFDSLIDFVLHDSLVYEHAIGSSDDSLAVAQGRVRREKFKVAVRDTVFGNRKPTEQEIMNMRYIPYSDMTESGEKGQLQEFLMDAGQLTTESQVVVPVFEARAPYKTFMADMDKQLLINLLDDRARTNRYKGLKVGSMTEATNDAGNWE